MLWKISLALISLLVCNLIDDSYGTRAENDKVYLKEWAVKVAGGERVAREVADNHGFQYVRKIGNLRDLYHFKHEDRRRSKRLSDMTEILSEDSRVEWVEQQHLNEHHKRDFRELPDIHGILPDGWTAPPGILPPNWTGDDDKPLYFDDPWFYKQWYLFSKGQNGATRGIDMNTMPAWKLGITGRGVVVSIVDDGVDPTHPDLAPNFDLEASHDFQNDSSEHDHNPHPDDSPEKGSENDHGTKCAGEVAAASNNSVCGVGVAFEASIGGMRMLDGPVTDAMEASALTWNNQHIDIYSCCWGPPDDGNNFRGPHKLTAQALETGVTEGRGGKGNIFVWASGNGGEQDDCSADGYVSDIRSISIGAVNDKGLSTYFMESCPSTMAAVVSGGPSDLDQTKRNGAPLNLVVTTDLHHGCTDHFVGTSSSAPLASGVMALILQANPELTWRDVQHIITQGAMIPNTMQDGWHINGAGFHVNHMFGFGVLDAGKMVELALTWEHVGKQRKCEVAIEKIENLKVPMSSAMNATLDISKCAHITKLEHTIAHITFEAPRRGDVSLRLISPSGTPSDLLSTRPNDHTDEGLKKWPFMTVHNWGEDPSGEWILELTNNMPSKDVLQGYMDDQDIDQEDEGEVIELVPRLTKKAVLVEWGFTFYGTGEPGDSSEEEDDEPEDDNPAINPEQTGVADKETVIDIWNDEQADDEEIHIDPEDLSPNAIIPPNFIHNFEDGEIDTGAFDGHLPDEDANELPQKYRRLILMYMILLEEHLVEEEEGKRHEDLQDMDLMKAYRRVKDLNLQEVFKRIEEARAQDASKREQDNNLEELYGRVLEQHRREKEQEQQILQKRVEDAKREDLNKRVQDLYERVRVQIELSKRRLDWNENRERNLDRRELTLDDVLEQIEQ